MTIAVAGYGDDMKKVLWKMFPEALRLRAYLDEMRNLIYR
jgi:hypothetical protein